MLRTLQWMIALQFWQFRKHLAVTDKEPPPVGGIQGKQGMALPPCSIERQDAAKALLDDADAPTGFTGTLTYAFTPLDGSNECARPDG